MKSLVKIKKWLMFIYVIMIIFIVSTGCSMSHTGQQLSQKKTSNSWSIDFKSLNGDIAHVISRKDGNPSIINVDSEVQSGSLILQVQLAYKIEEIQIGNKRVDLSNWGDGDLILRIVADNAQDGSVDFTWEYDQSFDEAKIKVSRMTKDDVMKEYHYYFDLNDIQRKELADRGYSKDQIAKIDKQAFEGLESNWVISKKQVFYIKGTHPELEDVDISNWNNADVQAFRQSLYKKEKEKSSPSQEQIAELSKRGISLEIADKMLRDYINYDNLLAQSDDTLNRLKVKIIEADEQGNCFIKYRKALKEKYTDYMKHNGGAE